MNKLKCSTLTVLVLTLFWCGTLPSDTINSSKEPPVSYTFAVVPQFHSQTLFRTWTPILKQLSTETGIKFKLTGHSAFSGFENELRKGKYDFAYVNPYHAVMANKTQRYDAILSDTEHKAQGILVTKKTDNVNLGALKSSEIAFPSPNTLASSIIMRSDLKRKYKLDVKPQYLKTHADVYMGIYQGTYKAGSGVVRTFNKLSPRIKSQLKIVYRTEKIPAHPIIAHPRIPQSVKNKVIAAFEEMSKSPAAKAMLGKIPVTKLQKTNQSVYNKITFNTSL